jgi:hypothetical protein
MMTANFGGTWPLWARPRHEWLACRYRFRAMELITILNRCYRVQGFVYQHARFSPDRKSIEVSPNCNVARRRSGGCANRTLRALLIKRHEKKDLDSDASAKIGSSNRTLRDRSSSGIAASRPRWTRTAHSASARCSR